MQWQKPYKTLSISAVCLARRFHQFFDEKDIECMDNEVRVYDTNPQLLPEIGTDVETYWINVSRLKDSNGTLRFPVLTRLVRILMALPHGNADVERLFSKVTLIKTKLRNRLHDSTVNSILQVRVNDAKTACLHYEPSKDIVQNVRKSADSYNTSIATKRACTSTSSVTTGLPVKRNRKSKVDKNFITAEVLIDSDDSDE
jgi:hypothetical protein